MAFANDVVGGSTLLRPAIRSPNYVPGVSGWTINRDGTSEFAGGTFRGAVVVIDPATGNVLASIGANGNGSFQSVYAANDVIIGNLSVLSAITAAGRGLAGYFFTSGALPTVTPNNAFVDMMWTKWTVDSSRLYRIGITDGFRLTNNNLSNTYNVANKLIVAQVGGGSATICQSANGFSAGGDQASAMIEQIWAPTFSGPATVKWQCSTSQTSAISAQTNTGTAIFVEDIGPNIATAGGTGSPAGTTTFTTQYFATASQSYDSSFNSESDPNNLYTGQLAGRSHGSNENALWCFPGSTIRTDVSGATGISARLYMYCTGSDTANGSVSLAWMTNTTPPATITSGGTGQANRTNRWTGIPSWGFVDITSEFNTQIVTNLSNAAYLQSDFAVGSASFYGAGNATFKPYIQVTYTK